jgi:hypothetical protein
MMAIISCQLYQLEEIQRLFRETTSEIRIIFIVECDIYLEKRRNGCPADHPHSSNLYDIK